MANGLLAIAYGEVDDRKAARLRDCATVVGFTPPDEGHKLRVANFCRVRLCPMCSWRRSLKVAAHMHKIMAAIASSDKPQAYIFLSLTVKNCQPDKLAATLDKLGKAWKRMFERQEVKDAVNGYYRAIEVTHNLQDDTYHPHIHAVLAVNPSYFTSRNYIKQERWTELWSGALRADYTPIVHVKRIKGNTAKAVAEVAKYTMKASYYIIPDDWDLTIDTVRLLNAVLANRRFVGFGGVFKDWHKKLNLDDTENGDLIHLDGDKPTEEDKRLVFYAWSSGYRQYIRMEEA